jgi:hypothetical protein
MTKAATLLVIEHVVYPTSDSYQAVMSDLQMMVRTGGRNRTEQELRTLLDAGGFRLRRVLPTSGPDVIEAGPVD